MNPRGLFGICVVCSKQLEVHTEFRTVMMGIPQQARMVHKECADKGPAPIPYSVDMHTRSSESEGAE